ncbi:hypothetical protein AB4K20DRAFT_1971908 [Rhizopus microsporus]
MSTNFNSTSISITADLVCPTVPDYEESVQTITIKSDKFEKCLSGSPFLKLCQFTPLSICVIMLNSTSTIDTTNVLSSVDNDQGSSSNELEVMRPKKTLYLLSQVVALDYWQGTIKAAHDFGGFRLTANEEKKRRAVYCIDYDFACSMVEQLEENVYHCPDQTKMCKHTFLVSRVTKLPFSPRAPVPVAQQERFSAPNEDHGPSLPDLREVVTEREHDDTEPEVARGSQLASENDDDDGIEEERLITGNTTDLTDRRLHCLKSVLKSLLLDDKKDAFSIDDLKKECSDVEEKEAYPCLLILNALKPYIPKKKERFIIAHQLPFCILANDTLMYAETRQNKDVVFSSLFDMNAITMTCKSNGIKFAQNILLLSGTKTARLLGIKDTVSNSSKRCPASYDLRNHPSQEMQDLQAEITGIEKQLEDALKNENSRDFSKEINSLKLKWRNSSLEERSCLYNGIEQLKDERNRSFSLVQTTRDDLKLKRQMLHFKRIAMKQQSIIAHKAAITSENINDQLYVIQKHGHGIAKVEDC